MTSGRSAIEAHLIHLEETLSQISEQVDRQVSNANTLSNNLKQLTDKYSALDLRLQETERFFRDECDNLLETIKTNYKQFTTFKSLPDPYLEKLLSLEAEMHKLNRALATDIQERLAENSKRIHFLKQDIKAIGDTVAHTQSLNSPSIAEMIGSGVSMPQVLDETPAWEYPASTTSFSDDEDDMANTSNNSIESQHSKAIYTVLADELDDYFSQATNPYLDDGVVHMNGAGGGMDARQIPLPSLSESSPPESSTSSFSCASALFDHDEMAPIGETHTNKGEEAEYPPASGAQAGQADSLSMLAPAALSVIPVGQSILTTKASAKPPLSKSELGLPSSLLLCGT